MDVWFDSGSSWNGVVVNRQELKYPADLYLEEFDNTVVGLTHPLITSIYLTMALLHINKSCLGFALDGKGRRCLKSLGNMLLQVKKKFGARNLASLGNKLLDSQATTYVSLWYRGPGCRETYRKIRNTLRFLIASPHLTCSAQLKTLDTMRASFC